MKTLRMFFMLALFAVIVAVDADAQSQRRDRSQQHQPLLQSKMGGAGLIGKTAVVGVPDSRPRFVRSARNAGARLLGQLRRVPQQYPTIQAAIDATFEGDTVLVSEGTYYENITFYGMPIIVASQYLLDNDTSHISRTIIDGSQHSNPDSGSVVYFIYGEDTTSVLCGFTIRGGTGTPYFYLGAVWCRVGGGVFCESSGPRIVRNIITRNRVIAETVEGGGVCAMGTASIHPYVILEGNHITDNYVSGTSSTTWAWSGGADICNASARVVGNVFERDTVVGAYMAVGGGIGMATDRPAMLVNGRIEGNFFRSNVVNATLGGGVGAGMTVAATGGVTISENLFENNIGTSVSGWAMGGGLCVDDQSVSGYGRKMIQKNQFLNNHLTRGGGFGCGAGVLLYRTLATLNANEIADNSADGSGAGVYAYSSAFRLENNIVTRNSTITDGGGLDIEGAPQIGTEQVIINNTIFDNLASYGGGMLVSSSANVVSLNNIFWADTAQEGNEISVDFSATANVNYCDIQGEWPSGTGNINANPSFASTTFQLSDWSPCIGAGRDSLQIGGVWYRVPPLCFYGGPRPNPAGSQADIGACENSRSTPTEVGERRAELPMRFELSQNYPNPFNPSTTINYQLPTQSYVTLKVFDILGREVATLIDGVEQPGYRSAQWDASGLTSGVYFCRLSTTNFVQTRKLLLLR